ncbi:MAG: cobyrinate a,c-diamide synthase [Nitrososphaerales archaeon]
MIPRIVIAGVTSGVGKTSISIAIMKALTEKGYVVQGFKVGPDYIDPSYHTSVTNRLSRNLDPWLMGENGLLQSFYDACKDADFVVIEGVMGLFDGLSGSSNFASTAHIAKLLKTPIVLVIDAAKAARSVAAVALGFMKFDSSIKIAGVILNNVAGDKHAKYCIDAIKQVNIPILGNIKRNQNIQLQERHLGLIPTSERKDVLAKLMAVANYVKEQIDIDQTISIAKKVPKLQILPNSVHKKIDAMIAVALDESFNFYYADNLDILRSLGAELKFFSPVNDTHLPNADGLYIGGGFPEVLSYKLEKNYDMLKSIRKVTIDGMPTYAECGGLMYLTRSIMEFDGEKHNMVNIFDVDTIMGKKLTLNYTDAKVINSCIIARPGKTIHGHEFHYSRIDEIPSDARFAYQLKKGVGVNGYNDGFIEYNTLASYMHIHFTCANSAENFLRACKKYSNR